MRDDDPDGAMPDAYDRPSTAPLPASAPGDPVTLDLVVDDRVLEAFVDGDAAVLTTATVGSLDGAALSVEAVDGTTRVTDASWTAFDAAG
ncbi:GH32 C-terminal domain-containing protein [Clavibacter tessellarius]|uniref:GH32 C-terminal domain-containing protein n=1 Tax=Clavibacter tessellarius TaxID=31965 RepID=UPI00324EF76D